MAFDKKKYLFYRGMLENNTERLSLEQLFLQKALRVVWGWCVVEESHLVRFVGLYETERVTSETHRGKSF